jgi:hypothetical protein
MHVVVDCYSSTEMLHLGSGRLAQVHLPSKSEALSSNYSTTKKYI